MKKFMLSLWALVVAASASYAVTVNISASGLTFNPAAVTINQGDVISFTMGGNHNAVEVSQATWDANGSTPLQGGFSVPFGGGQLTSLTPGDYYYVCTNHAGAGMKGKITVLATAIPGFKSRNDLSVYPNPALNVIQVRTSSEECQPFFITDQTGRKILHGRFSQLQPGIDISSLKNGKYFLVIQDSSSAILPFIKE